MSSTNYIKHLTEVFQIISDDTNLNPTHVSLYIALFQFWNLNRFKNPFYIHRDDVMKLSKIGSKTTYHRCLRDLDTWKYIVYHPSHNPLKGSKIEMTKYGTSSGQVVGQLMGQKSAKSGQVVGQALVSLINNNKHIKTNKQERPNTINEVFYFFKKNEWPKIEGEKFFNYYETLNWKIKGITKIYDWKAAAKNWMLKASEFKMKSNENLNEVQKPQQQSNLKVLKNKNYNEPL